MNRETIFIGLLAILLLIEWGERSVLQARFENYLQELHWPAAHAECAKIARNEYGAKIVMDKFHYWNFIELRFGTAPSAWPRRYVRWGDHWDIRNASMSLVYEFGECPHSYVCNYRPAGGGGARVQQDLYVLHHTPGCPAKNAQ